MHAHAKPFRARLVPELYGPIRELAHALDVRNSEAACTLIRQGLAAPAEMTLDDVKEAGSYRLYDGEDEYVREFDPFDGSWSSADAPDSAMAYGPLPRPTR